MTDIPARIMKCDLDELDKHIRQTQGRPVPPMILKKFIEEELDKITLQLVRAKFSKYKPADLVNLKLLVNEGQGREVKKQPPARKRRVTAEAPAGEVVL